jgi:putative ABC transport system permease protein
MAGSLKEEFPEIEAAVLMIPTGSAWMMRYDDERHFEYNVFQVAGELLEVFSMPLVSGNPATALVEPGSVVLTESTSLRYFGKADPLGKRIMADEDWAVLTVTGVMRDHSGPSHVAGDMYIRPPNNRMDLSVYWGEPEGYTYVRLVDGAEPQSVESKAPSVFDKYNPVLQPDKDFNDLRLQPLTDIHLFSQFPDELGVSGSIETLYLLLILVACLLFVAALNFTNLTTARSLVRLCDIGVRKAVGASRRQILVQYLGEAVVLAVVAGIVSLLASAILLPWFGDISGKSLDRAVLLDGGVLISLLCLSLLTGLLSGFYPALHLSKSPPLTMLGNSSMLVHRGKALRQVLVVGQFTVALSLVIGAGTLSSQLEYLQSRRIGLEPDQVVLVRDFGGEDIQHKFRAITAALKEHPGIVDATRVSLMPGVSMGGDMLINGSSVRYVAITPGFVETFGVKLLAGRTYTAATKPDSYVITRAAAELLGFTPEAAIGQQVTVFYDRGAGDFSIPAGDIIGVVEDFQIDSLRRPLRPIVMPTQNNVGYYGATPFVRLQTDDLQGALAHIEKTWRTFVPSRPFEYVFLDEIYAQLYRSEMRLERVSRWLSAVAMLVALIGVFGLTGYMAERRKREIGIRRVVGATSINLIRLVSREMLLLSLAAIALGFPIAHVAAMQWLSGFAYRTEPDIWLCLSAGAGLLLLTQLTVTYHAMIMVRADPAVSLRHE